MIFRTKISVFVCALCIFCSRNVTFNNNLQGMGEARMWTIFSYFSKLLFNIIKLVVLG